MTEQLSQWVSLDRISHLFMMMLFKVATILQFAYCKLLLAYLFPETHSECALTVYVLTVRTYIRVTCNESSNMATVRKKGFEL